MNALAERLRSCTPAARRARRQRELAEAAAWPRRLYEATRSTGGRLDLGVITRDGWAMPEDTRRTLAEIGTFRNRA